ncbi:MAG: lipid A deacylase LpxR family protein [Sulfurimonas sp.]|nr:lipid A deacylase LpxR family protein [Sulfurimonas sp.]
MKKRFLFFLFSVALNADQFSFLLYNDFFAGTDKHFTNGMSLSWIDDTCGSVDKNNSNSYSNFMLDAVNTLPLTLMDSSKQHNAGISLSQIAITPTDISISTPQYNDMPYAGYLALAFYMFEWDKKNFREYRMEVGVVGKESGAGFVQKAFHRLIGNSEPKGWDTQIGTQYTANALIRYGEKSWESHDINGLTMDWFNHFGLQAGNFVTDIFGGTIIRIGNNYIENFNLHYPYLKEEASLLRLDKKHHGFGWSFSAGINTELLAYSYILDEAKKEGYSADKNILNIAIYAGADLYYEAHKITFFYQTQSPYTNQQTDMDIFGGLIYAFQF